MNTRETEALRLRAEAAERAAIEAVRQRDMLADALRDVLPVWESGIQEPWVTKAKAALEQVQP